MADILDPLNTLLIVTADHDEADVMAEIDALFQRQTLVDRIMAGEASHEDLLDCLSTQQLNPDEYIEAVTGAIEDVLSGRIVIENPEDIKVYRG
jgi:alkaline phosphatase